MPALALQSDFPRDFRCLVTMREVTMALTALLLVSLMFLLGRVSALVVLITPGKDTLPFPDMEAAFSPKVPAGGISGMLYPAEPLDACRPVESPPAASNRGAFLPIALAVRGNCYFEEKVRHAQDAGYFAVIVFNNEDFPSLVTMSGSSSGVHIHAVFISRAAGETFLHYVQDNETTCFIVPSSRSSSRSLLIVTTVLLLSAMIFSSIIFVVRRYRLRRDGSRVLFLQEAFGMTLQELKLLPTSIYRNVKSTNATCAICLEDYVMGEKLRVLPCQHDFHSLCVDHWLTTRRPFCPVCKRDAHLRPPSESTPLLSDARQQNGPELVTSLRSAATGTDSNAVGSETALGFLPSRTRSYGSTEEDDC